MRILCTIATDMDYAPHMRSLEYQTFLPACRQLGETFLFSFGAKTEQRALNDEFVEAVRVFKPDVVFTVPFTDQWLPGTMESVECPTVAWFCDSYRRDYLIQEIPRYSHIVGTDEKTIQMAAEEGRPAMLSTWACNPEFHVPGKEKDLDVVWIGQNSAWRRHYIDKLQKYFPNRVVVRGWNFPGGPVTWGAYVALLGRAKIGLSFSMDMSGQPQAKLRPFEVAACRSLVLAEKPNYLAGYLSPGHEYVPFFTIDDMVDQTAYYLSHDEEREAITEAGYERTVTEHTFENRLKEVFAWALSTRA